MLLVLTGGCADDLGPGDERAALEVVYDAQGVPAFAGQALVIQSCGAGGFCHAEVGAGELERRFGAPAGLDFDLRVASTTTAAEDAASQRLWRDQLRVLAMREHVFDQVRSGAMPPGGAAGEAYAEETAHVRFERVADDGVTFTPLPSLDTDEGRELLRVWLATRVPVVERTESRGDGSGNVTGFTVAACPRTCVDVTWERIYADVIEPSCASSACHDDVEPAGALDLSGGAGVVLDRITGAPPAGELCAASGVPILTPGEPSASLLYLKMAAARSSDVCGNRMPLSGNPPSPQALCAIEAWIDCGACGADDPRCDACADEARARCGVMITEGEPRCASPAPCPNRP